MMMILASVMSARIRQQRGTSRYGLCFEADALFSYTQRVIENTRRQWPVTARHQQDSLSGKIYFTPTGYRAWSDGIPRYVPRWL